MILQTDDVVVSTATATTEHRVSVGANPTGPVCPNHDAAVIKRRNWRGFFRWTRGSPKTTHIS